MDREVVIVSSGAVTAGLDPLGFTSKPKDLPSAQAAAAVGRGLLMVRWMAAFQVHHLGAAQVLLTTDDIMRHDHYANACVSLAQLLGLSVVPIFNENDAVTTRKLRFGDNDRLVVLIAQMIRADALVLLTDVNGLYTAPLDHPGSELTKRVESADDLMGVLVAGTSSRAGTSGMATKVQTAILTSTNDIGAQLALADASESVLVGKNVGTWFEPSRERPASRRLWTTYAVPSRGEIIVDEGAAQAITVDRKSLLVVDVRSTLGHFKAGDVVDVASPTRLVIRGMSGYDSDTLAEIAGSGTMELQATGHERPRPTTHHDNLAVLGDVFSAPSAD